MGRSSINTTTLAALFLAALTVGFAKADAAALEDRVLTRWQALIKGDFEQAYTFESPAYRQLYTANQFAGRFGQSVEWLGVEVGEIALNNDQTAADVTVYVDYRFVPPRGSVVESTRLLVEKWIFTDDEWWYATR